MTTTRRTATVIICTYNRAELTRLALQSIREQTFDEPERIDVLVVDNNSTDHTPQMVQEVAAEFPYPVSYTMEKQQGLSHARNTGIQAAKGDIIIWLDDDGLALPTWLEGHIKPFDDDPLVHGVMGKIIPTYESERPDWIDPLLEIYLGSIDKGDAIIPLVYPETPPGGNGAFLKSTLLEVGMYDVRFGFGGAKGIPCEDNEIAWRIYEKGYKMVYSPLAAIYHGVPEAKATVKFLTRRVFGQGRAEMMMDKEHNTSGVSVSKVAKGLFRAPLFGASSLAGYVIGNKQRASRHATVSFYHLGYVYEYFTSLGKKS